MRSPDDVMLQEWAVPTRRVVADLDDAAGTGTTGDEGSGVFSVS